MKSQSDNENASKRPQLKAKMNIKCDGKGMRVEGEWWGELSRNIQKTRKSRAKTKNRSQNYARLEKPAGGGKNSPLTWI